MTIRSVWPVDEMGVGSSPVGSAHRNGAHPLRIERRDRDRRVESMPGHPAEGIRSAGGAGAFRRRGAHDPVHDDVEVLWIAS
jgi:hypothetical protein